MPPIYLPPQRPKPSLQEFQYRQPGPTRLPYGDSICGKIVLPCSRRFQRRAKL